MTSKTQRIEIVGVAGSGKSSLSEALLSSDLGIEDGWRFRNPRSAWGAAQCILRHPLWWLGTILSPPTLDRTSLVSLLTMAIQCELSTRPTQTDAPVVLYDQGAIFSMARLRILGKSSNNRFASKLIDRCMSVWSRELDGIIFVDAPNEILFERINSRPQEHRMAGQDPVDVYEFLRGYRDVFDELMDELCRRSDIPILRLCTDKHDLSETLSRSLEFLSASSKESS